MSEEKPIAEIGWSEIAALILASRGITSGLWRLGVKVRFAALNMQFPEENKGVINLLALPSTLAALEAILVFPAQAPGPMIFDAAELLSLAKRHHKPVAKAKPFAGKLAGSGHQNAKIQPGLSKAKARTTKIKP